MRPVENFLLEPVDQPESIVSKFASP